MRKYIAQLTIVCVLLSIVGCGRKWNNPVDPTVPPAVPVLTSPLNNSTGISVNPLFKWNAAAGAASYNLQVSKNSSFDTLLLNITGITTTSKSITGLLYFTKYYWRVKSVKEDMASAWSGALYFTTTTANAPDAVTGDVTNVSETSAQLNGTVDPKGDPTTCYFEYGLTTAYGLTTPVQNIGTANGAVSAFVEGCDVVTTYHYRIVASNSGGTSYGNDISFATLSPPIEWVSIPAGNFTMGSTATDTLSWPNYDSADELPQHTVYLDAYQVSKYEITNAQYKAFMDAGGYNNSIYWSGTGWNWRVYSGITEPAYWSSGVYNSGPAYPYHPVLGVCWYEADAFCRWAGGHLPTEAQWEKAARGIDPTNYWPWGSTWDAAKCNSVNNTFPDTFEFSSPVGFFTTGQSPYGVYDMAGNVWELVNDWYQKDYYSVSPDSNPIGPLTGTFRVIRGGGFFYYDYHCRVASRVYLEPYVQIFPGGVCGFRIAK